MKDPLDYTHAELQDLGTEELEKLLAESAYLESQFNTQQMSEKTLINSLFGAFANRHFPLFNENLAGAITANGRYFIQKLANYIERGLQELLPQEKRYITYGDTDSVYFSIAVFMDRYQKKNPGLTMDQYVTWADEFEKKVIQPMIRRTIKDFSSELHAFNSGIIGVEREIIADVAVFTNRKKYYARIRDNEGTRYPEDSPKIKVMGLDLIKSSTPPWCKKYLKLAIPHILDKDEGDLRDWIREIKGEFVQVNLNQIAAVGGVSRVDYDLVRDTVPIGSRAAIRHNQYVKAQGIDGKFAPIQGGDKCKRLFLIQPNKFLSNIVAFTNDSFVQEINGCVDFDTQFQKTFLKPLELMVAPLGYDLERETGDLDDW